VNSASHQAGSRKSMLKNSLGILSSRLISIAVSWVSVSAISLISAAIQSYNDFSRDNFSL
jgi:hypothetical protein